MLIRLSLILVGVISLASLQAFGMTEEDQKFYTLQKPEFVEIGRTPITQSDLDVMTGVHGVVPYKNAAANIVGVGEVIKIGRDLVALGEDIYTLVQKGKPTVKTDYAPISIVPKVNGAPADVFDLENFRAPVKYTYELRYPNAYNINVVVFRFSVIYSYGGTYQGSGAYITGAQIIPDSVRVLFGWDFNATMKLGGIQNNGTKANPNAGATLLLEYNIQSVLVAERKTVPFFITGRGGFKKL